MSPKIRKVKPVEQEPAPEVTFDEIAARAYEIHSSGEGGDELENWLRAEEQLHAELHGATEVEPPAEMTVAA